jgi:hypothetical protein
LPIFHNARSALYFDWFSIPTDISHEPEIAETEEENIHNSWGPKRIVLGKGKVAIKCKQVFDEMHRFNPQYDETVTKKGRQGLAFGRPEY